MFPKAEGLFVFVRYNNAQHTTALVDTPTGVKACSTTHLCPFYDTVFHAEFTPALGKGIRHMLSPH